MSYLLNLHFKFYKTGDIGKLIAHDLSDSDTFFSLDYKYLSIVWKKNSLD